jgi:hypothetical protein
MAHQKFPVRKFYGLSKGVGRDLAVGRDRGVGVAVAGGEAHSPIANLFRCYFAILITGADAVLVADAAQPCVVQP